MVLGSTILKAHIIGSKLLIAHVIVRRRRIYKKKGNSREVSSSEWDWCRCLYLCMLPT